ncbi:deoxyribodipyrimidine photolyase [Hokovirus HKV1]|uniref:Deoxyribodipyrimidine photolyase n=1 Tax=Hokovirus HKV1 TaxID=1977638 RepID=A0A1V0SGL1_9VIRU|nr:deoxyribodipyrimidine photolyase [Hokovirus HKV1]
MKKHNTSLFIFRRDLRLYDNTALINASKNSNMVIPIFIFTKDQLINNPYKSDNCVQFMMSCLDNLDQMLKKHNSKLYYFFGDNDTIIKKIIKNNKIDAIYLNSDYTPFSIKRDENIKEICLNNNIEFCPYEDVLLLPINHVKTKQDTTYTKFTPYFNAAKKIKINLPNTYTCKNFINKKTKIIGTFEGDKSKFYKNNPNIAFLAQDYINVLANIKNFKEYNKNRNNLNYETTHLSAYIKFGIVSIRQVYEKFLELGKNNDLIKQLFWRDFYYNIAFNYNYIFSKKGNLKKNYDNIKWPNNNTYYKKWCEGLTGYPVVDACMRQLNASGYMHNRGRLITSSFLIKILLVDWKKGELYFANKLIDYDPSLNTGNWGWSSGSGADAQPYFRIFNPWLQSAKYDKDATYIKKWIPELKDVPSKDIHNWYLEYDKYKNINYVKPIVDYKTQKKLALKLYKSAY